MQFFNKVQAAIVAREEGATMVEYGIVVALIAAISIAMIGLIGGDVLAAFTTVEAGM